MAASIQHIYICPRCEEGITAHAPGSSCPKCKLILGLPDNGFRPPVTLHEQSLKLNDETQHRKTLVDLAYAKSESMLLDALGIIEMIPAKKHRGSDISRLVDIAMRIGDIARGYDAYIKAGGRHVPTLYFEPETPSSTPSESNHESPSQTGVGSDASDGPRVPIEPSPFPLS